MNRDSQPREVSDAYAHQFLEVLRRFEPELTTVHGMKGAEDQTFVLSGDEQVEAFSRLKRTLERATQKETDREVIFDLEILLDAVHLRLERLRIERDVGAVLRSPTESMYLGISGAGQAEHRLARLRRYVGHTDAPALTDQAIAYFKAGFARRLMPRRREVELEIINSVTRLRAIRRCFLLNSEEPGELAVLGRQIAQWRTFLRTELIPRSLRSHRLPRQVFVHHLATYGVEVEPEQLIDRVREFYCKCLDDLAQCAENEDYLAELREIYADQVSPALARGVYETWSTRLRREVIQTKFASLPKRELLISISPTAREHEPYLYPPPLLSNPDGPLTFILPGSILSRPDAPYDFLARAAIPVIVLEQIVAHGLHLGASLDAGISKARLLIDSGEAFYAGWSLYACEKLGRSLPREARMVLLHRRLLVAARAFLEAGLQVGRRGPERARELLAGPVGLSGFNAADQLDALLYHEPGKASAAFMGYLKLKELGDLSTHDRITSAGMLSLGRLQKVLEDT